MAQLVIESITFLIVPWLHSITPERFGNHVNVRVFGDVFGIYFDKDEV